MPKEKPSAVSESVPSTEHGNVSPRRDCSVLDVDQATWNPAVSVLDVEFSNHYPALATWLFEVCDAGGKPRTLPSLKIWADRSTVRVLLYRPDVEKMTFGEGPNVGDALRSLETSLATRTASWHVKRPPRSS